MNTKEKARIVTLVVQCFCISACVLLIASSYRAIAQQGKAKPAVLPSPGWNSIVQQIVKNIPGFTPGPGFQVLPVATEATWNQKFGQYYLWQVLGNTIPQWGKVYYPSQLTVTEGYFTFLTNLDIPAPNQNEAKKAMTVRQKYISAHLAIAQLLSEKSAFANGVLTTSSAAKLDRLEHQAQNYAQVYSSYLVRSLGGFAEAGTLLTNYENPAYQEAALSPDGLTLPYRTFNITPDLSEWVEQSSKKPAVEFAKDEVDKVSPLIAFDTLTAKKSSSSVVSGAKPMITIETAQQAAGSKVPDPRVGLNEKNFSQVSLSARRVTIFHLQPSLWFNGTAVKAFGAGPWLEGPVKQGQVKLWGKDGIFALMPTAVVVLYDPSVELTAKPELASSVKASVSTAVSVSFGPLQFGGSYQEKSGLTFDEKKNSVRLSAPSGRAYIIAVINCVLPGCD